MKRPIPPQTKKQPKGMNKTELDYAAYLEILRKAGEILEWKYEGMRLRLADGSIYTGDFVVTYPDRVEIHETKGFMREAARVRLLVAAELWWQFRFKLVRRVKGRWDISEV